MDPAHSPSASERLARRQSLAKWEEYFGLFDSQWGELVADGERATAAWEPLRSDLAPQARQGDSWDTPPGKRSRRRRGRHRAGGVPECRGAYNATLSTSLADLGAPVWREASLVCSPLSAEDEKHRQVWSVGTSSPAEGTQWAVRQGQWSVARYAADLEDMAFFYGWPASPADVFVEGLNPRIRVFI